MTFAINGKFVTENMQGIVRYANEIVLALDHLIEDCVVVYLVVPQKAMYIPPLKRIKIVRIGDYSGLLWEQIDFRNYVKRNNLVPINFCNIAPLYTMPGITFIHDIMYKLFPENYSSLRNKLSRIWHCLQYIYITHHEKVVVTVSDFSRRDIEKNYPKSVGKVDVIYSAWQHIKKIDISTQWREKYPFLETKRFYFSLSQISGNKNGKWIIEVAKRNPNDIFAMAGKIYDKGLDSIPQNVKLLGYISDEDAVALMGNCKAFLFPSLYEGFGLPPLEAIGLGAKVIISNSSCLPEIYGDSAYYIDPYNYEVNLNQILREKNSNNDVLVKYDWERSAKKLLEILQNFNG